MGGHFVGIQNQFKASSYPRVVDHWAGEDRLPTVKQSETQIASNDIKDLHNLAPLVLSGILAGQFSFNSPAESFPAYLRLDPPEAGSKVSNLSASS